MAITVDSRNTGATSTGASTLSWSHTVGAGANFLVVNSDAAASPRPTVSGIDWDFGVTPQALTLQGGVNETDIFGRAEIWYLKVPVSGTKTIKVTYSVSGECGTGSSSWNAVDQTTPFNAASPQTQTGTGTGQQPVLVVTTSAGEWVIDSVIGITPGSGTLAVDASQTQISNHNRGVGTSYGAGSDEAAVGASTTMSWTGAASGDTWAQVGVSLVPESGFAAPSRSRKLATQQRMVA